MKVGDKVKIIKGAYNGDMEGDIGIIYKIDVCVDVQTVYLQAKPGMLRSIYFKHEIELVEENKPDVRFDVQKQMLKNHNFRYDAYMKTRDELIEYEFAKRRDLAQKVYDELRFEERIKVGL